MTFSLGPRLQSARTLNATRPTSRSQSTRKPEFNNTEECYQSIPAEMRPRKDQPFYHLLAQNAETTYIAYVSEQNLLPDAKHGPVRHPMVKEMFEGIAKGRYRIRKSRAN